MSNETNNAWVNAYYGHDAHPIVDNKPAAALGIDLRNAILQLREDALHMKDPGDTVNTYDRVLRLIDASPNGGISDCPVIRLAPGEYTDWEKRVWRRGVIEAVTQPDIALAANMSALIERLISFSAIGLR